MPDLTIWNSALTLTALLSVLIFIDKTFALIRTFAANPNVPGRQILFFHPYRQTALLTGSFFPPKTRAGCFYAKFNLFSKYGSTILLTVKAWDAAPIFFVADADALKVVTTDKNAFKKPIEAYKVLEFHGPNVVTTEGQMWRRHRAVANPAFNEANNALVWSETNKVLGEWFEGIQARKREGTEYVTLNAINEMKLITMLLVTTAAFGKPSTLQSFVAKPPSTSTHTLTLPAALQHTVSSLLVRTFFPNRISLPIAYVRRSQEAWDELGAYMREMIVDARADVQFEDEGKDGGKVTKSALLRGLVEANLSTGLEDGAGTRSLTDNELLSNVFAFLIAGHESTSHTLSFALILIAFYPRVQEKIYAEAKALWPDKCPAFGKQSTYREDFDKLVYTQATFRETLRHHPVVPRLDKIVTEDRVLVGHRFAAATGVKNRENEGESRFEVHIPKGAILLVDIQALHMNPMYWGEDATSFEPEKFIDTDTYKWNRDAFLAFSAGARGCIGKRFALSESVSLLAQLVYTYELRLPEDIEATLGEMERRGVGVVQRMDWLCAWYPWITNTPTRAKIRVRRRV